MRALRHALAGVKAVLRLWKMVLLLGAVNLAAALVLAVPLLTLLQDSVGSSRAGRNLSSGFDYVWWQEFRDTRSGLADTFSPDIIGRGALLSNAEALLYLRFTDWPSSVLALLVLYILAHTFLAGGVVTSLARPPSAFRPAEFFSGAGRSFFRFLGLALLSWILFFGLGLPLQSVLDKVLDRASSQAVTEVGPFLVDLGLRAGFLVFLVIIQTVFDYARVITVAAGGRNIFSGLKKALLFVLGHPLTVSALAALFVLASGLVSTAYVLVKEAIPLRAAWSAPVSFLWLQAFILTLIALRGASYASQLSLFRFHGLTGERA